jgi:hypothetical protein
MAPRWGDEAIAQKHWRSYTGSEGDWELRLRKRYAFFPTVRGLDIDPPEGDPGPNGRKRPGDGLDGARGRDLSVLTTFHSATQPHLPNISPIEASFQK